jgi:tetratricopeptide (TPR) repeat protein
VIEQSSKALELNPNLTSLRKLRGLANFYLQKYNSAVQDLTLYLNNADSLDNLVLEHRANIFDQLNQPVAAAEDRIRILKYHVLEYETFIKQINIILQSGDSLKALYHLDRFTLQNKSTAAHIKKLDILLKFKDWGRINAEVEAGLQSLNRGVYSNLQLSFLFYCKALVYVQNKDYSEAETYFNKAFGINRNPIILVGRARLYILTGNIRSAKKDLKLATSLGSEEASLILKSLSEQ